MGLARKPDSGLAGEVLPAPLYRALTHVFAQGIHGAMLVGGTALAGYYASHRRSDDLDLFTEDSLAQKAAVLSVQSLRQLGSSFADERSSAHFHHVTCRLEGHDFTAQVVLDPNVYSIGSGLEAGDGVVVAAPETLLKMKAATLVSRASEKDLYDLAWFFRQDDQLDIADLIELGKEVDGGMTAEAVLTSLVAAEMQESACDFSLSQNPEEVLSEVVRVQKSLIQGVTSHLKEQPAPPIAALIQKLKLR
jgi:hypothetical protein